MCPVPGTWLGMIVVAAALAVAHLGGGLGAPAVTAVLAAAVAGCVELALHHRHGEAADATSPKEALVP
jgi:hypothetical protein